MLFSNLDLFFITLIFIWSAFVRTGLGFGGAVLSLPLLLLVGGNVIYWLPIIAIHLLFFCVVVILKEIASIDWRYLRKSLIWIMPAKIMGVLGILQMPNNIISVLIYSITLVYSIFWILNYNFKNNSYWMEPIFLFLGGYISGTALTGAPLIVPVYAKHVLIANLRNTLFALWFILVSIKMSAFISFGVYIDWLYSLYLIPPAIIGHFIGIKLHQVIIKNDILFKKYIGVVLFLISFISILRIVA